MSESPSVPPPNPTGTHPSGFSYWLATAFGLGRLPKAPGTWGSLAGVALAWMFAALELRTFPFDAHKVSAYLLDPFLWWLLLSAAGVFAAGRVERAAGRKDPQEVVIDEVSGQWLAFLLGPAMLGAAAGWKSFLAGLILFRVFDITKPFPARSVESLPGGWGIMVDDWVAGLYAAACLWLAHGLGF
ncbi:MAG TPA: phosphatidylglycerophosphatase A [Patescibacteria group bacterium]|nr:phosphatidylglycerophosphatase A [Patescibacteria group bacterium]